MSETLANGYSSESTRGELSNEYQHDRVKMTFIPFLLFGALDESNLSIRSVKWYCTILPNRFLQKHMGL